MPEAEASFLDGDFAQAATLYSTALAIEKVSEAPHMWAQAVLYTSKAACHRRMREFDVAFAELRHAIRLYPRYKKAIFERGVAQLDAGNPTEALQEFTWLLRLDRDWPQLGGWVVRAATAEMRHKKALETEQNGTELPAQSTEHCVAWRQTGGCNPNGSREPTADIGCDQQVENGRSGFCECKPRSKGQGGSEMGFEMGGMSSASNCQHQAFTCAAQCEALFNEAVERAKSNALRLRDAGSVHRVDQAHAIDKAVEEAVEDVRQEAIQVQHAKTHTECDGAMEVNGGQFICKNKGKEEARRQSWDHYFVLNVARDFSPDELKRGYRKMSLQMHPDKQGGSDDAFQRVATAHQVLSDAQKRGEWDEGLDMKRVQEQHEEHEPQAPKEEVERKYFPERFGFNPFGEEHVKEKTRHYEEIQSRLAHAQKQHQQEDPPSEEEPPPEDETHPDNEGYPMDIDDKGHDPDYPINEEDMDDPTYDGQEENEEEEGMSQSRDEV